MNNSINEIEKIFKNTKIENIKNVSEEFNTDIRKGVQSIIKKYLKKYNSYINELQRLENLSFYENKFYNLNKNIIVGIDEVGRGPLAGPVVAAAVILPKGCKIIGVDDSKKLSSKKRELLYNEIYENALSIGIGIVNNIVIDEINILQATYKAMKEAIQNLNILPNQILIDAVKIPKVDIPQESIVRGDTKSISIASASIIAKVTRDRLMIKYHEIYPEFDFLNNKGYGSKKHIEAIEKFGLCPLHRKSFTKNFV